MPSYISLSLSGGRIVVIAKTEEDIRRFFEALKKYGIVSNVSTTTRCG